MKNFLNSRDGASKGAALMIVLAFVVLLTGLALAYMSRTTTDRQLAETSYNDTSADLLARSALDIVVNDFKQEILNNPTVSRTNIQPSRYTPPPQVVGTPIPNLIRQSFSGDPTNRTSSVNSGTASANGRFISTTRWNSHYLIPRSNTASVDNTIDSMPVGTNQSTYSSFTAPDWVLVTGQGATPAPSPNAVIGRYAFAVYDEGGLLDMTVAGYPSWTSCNTPTPTPTPWLVNVGQKGTVAFADLSVLPWPSASPSPRGRIDNIVGWRNYAMTQRTGSNFGNFTYTGETDCTKQDSYGSYLLNFGDPPFIIDSVADKLTAAIYPFTATGTYVYPSATPARTDQAITTRQQLLKLMLSLGSSTAGYNQNVLQYMGTFSRERNRPAPDWWPSPSPTPVALTERYNLNNLALVLPNPADCNIAHGRKVGWQTGKNKNHLCGNSVEVNELFGLFWVRSDVVAPCPSPGICPGYWTYIGNVSSSPFPNPSATPTPRAGVDCLRGANRQSDFFQILNFALFGSQSCSVPGHQSDPNLATTFAIGASLIDQYDSGSACPSNGQANSQPVGCDLDYRAISTWNKPQYATHTTVIKYGRGNGSAIFSYGMEPDYSATVGSDGNTNGDAPYTDTHTDRPHRPQNAPTPFNGATNATIVESHAFSSVGELGYGIVTYTSPTPVPALYPLNFWDPGPTPSPAPIPGLFPYAPLLDFFSYNPISSAYPRAGIVNLYTRNAPVIAALLSQTLQTNAAASVSPTPSPVISGSPVATSQAMIAANAIVDETQKVLAGNPTIGSVQQSDLTRAIAGRLANRAFNAVPVLATSDETKNAVVRSLAEVGQTRTWNLFIDVIAQTGQYAPNATDVTQANKFIVQGEKRYWLHIALGRDLVHTDGTPCQPGDTGCQVDVLGTQLEEVTE